LFEKFLVCRKNIAFFYRKTSDFLYHLKNPQQQEPRYKFKKNRLKIPLHAEKISFLRYLPI
jgi:hypothetical protein